MQTDGPAGEFHSELLSRRGEFVAWGLALVVAATWVILFLFGRVNSWIVLLVGAFLLFSALSISLGNWMDRKTVIRLDPDGITFENGLRHSALQWHEIKQVQVFPSIWGKKVRVLGSHAHFEFRTLAEVKVQEAVKGRMGFVEGERILQQMIQKADLAVKPGETGEAGVYYIARE